VPQGRSYTPAMRPSKIAASGLGAVLLGVLLLAGPRAARGAPGPGPEPEPVRAERLSVELGLHGGAVVGQGLEELRGRGAGGLTFRALWPVGSGVRLGLRVGLLFTALPYGQEDDRLWIGVRPTDPALLYDGAVYTLIPSASFLFQVRIWRWLELDATVGLAAPFGVWKTGDQAAMVSPQLGVGLLLYIVRHRRVQVAVRAGFDAIPLLKHPRQAWLFLPMVGVLVRFPVRENPGTMGDGIFPSPAEPHQPGPRL
jgi:hypothetical protein